MEVSLYKSPFYVLEISSRDDSEHIIDQVESLSLVKDPDECLNFQNQLLNLNTRLKHEIEWLPGVEPTKVMPLIESDNVDLQRHALQCVSKLMVQNWEYVK